MNNKVITEIISFSHTLSRFLLFTVTLIVGRVYTTSQRKNTLRIWKKNNNPTLSVYLFIFTDLLLYTVGAPLKAKLDFFYGLAVKWTVRQAPQSQRTQESVQEMTHSYRHPFASCLVIAVAVPFCQSLQRVSVNTQFFFFAALPRKKWRRNLERKKKQKKL